MRRRPRNDPEDFHRLFDLVEELALRLRHLMIRRVKPGMEFVRHPGDIVGPLQIVDVVNLPSHLMGVAVPDPAGKLKDRPFDALAQVHHPVKPLLLHPVEILAQQVVRDLVLIDDDEVVNVRVVGDRLHTGIGAHIGDVVALRLQMRQDRRRLDLVPEGPEPDDHHGLIGLLPRLEFGGRISAQPEDHPEAVLFILRANLAFKAFPAPAGSLGDLLHCIKDVFRPEVVDVIRIGPRLPDVRVKVLVGQVEADVPAVLDDAGPFHKRADVILDVFQGVRREYRIPRSIREHRQVATVSADVSHPLPGVGLVAVQIRPVLEDPVHPPADIQHPSLRERDGEVPDTGVLTPRIIDAGFPDHSSLTGQAASRRMAATEKTPAVSSGGRVGCDRLLPRLAAVIVLVGNAGVVRGHGVGLRDLAHVLRLDVPRQVVRDHLGRDHVVTAHDRHVASLLLR